jgi:epoxyqueuosine reductase QueG
MTTTYEAQQEALTAQLDAHEAAEPECTCEQVDADVYDAHCCDICNLQSPWNRERRALEAQLEDVRADIAYQASGEWGWPEPWEQEEVA